MSGLRETGRFDENLTLIIFFYIRKFRTKTLTLQENIKYIKQRKVLLCVLIVMEVCCHDNRWSWWLDVIVVNLICSGRHRLGVIMVIVIVLSFFVIVVITMSSSLSSS